MSVWYREPNRREIKRPHQNIWAASLMPLSYVLGRPMHPSNLYVMISKIYTVMNLAKEIPMTMTSN
jgi:hypothetical protein